MLNKIKILSEDITNKGLYASIAHRIRKNKYAKPIVPFLNLLKPDYILINEKKMYIDKNDIVVSEELIRKKVWSKEETLVLKKHLKTGNTFVDVGAHIGYFTVLAADLVGPSGHVYAFEPNPRSFNLLQKNIRVNKFKNVTLFNKAVTNKVGELNLYANRLNTGDTRISKPDFESKAIKVKTTTLDIELKGKTADFIKIDVQGAEPLVIEGAETTLRSNKNIKMLIEFWIYGIKQLENDPDVFLNQLKSLNYKIENPMSSKLDVNRYGATLFLQKRD